MEDFIDREELNEIKSELEQKIKDLFIYLEKTVANDNPSGLIKINISKLNRLSDDLSKKATQLGKIKKHK